MTLYTFHCHAQQGSEILIQANKASLERDYKKAFNLYTDFIQINPSDFRGYFNRGTSAYNAKNYASAIQDFTKTLQLNPIFMEAYYFRGQSFFHLKKYRNAISDYSYGLLKKPNNSSFLKLRADAYAERQETLSVADLS